MRITRILTVVAALIVGLAGLAPQPASAAGLPSFPMALPVAWGYTVQAGGAHTHASGARSSVDLGASGGVSVPVVAAADGVVTVKGAGSWSRCYVVIQHADGWQTQYYHLKGIPSGLANGQTVKAGEKIGMTGMPGSETCGRGTFRHVHFSLYRNGVEQPISGISLGGYRFTATSGSYCGYWTRERDNVIVADARRACLAVPAVTNNQLHPDQLNPTGISMAAAHLSETRPVISPTNTTTLALAYTTPGYHSVNKRAWRTRCEAYSKGKRCFTDIWATTVRLTSSGYQFVEGWAFNNLTYTGMTREDWAGHIYAKNGTFTVGDRQWRTECATAATGPDGCRSYLWVTYYAATKNRWGLYDVVQKNGWVFNHQVWFAPSVSPLLAAARLAPASVDVVEPVVEEPVVEQTPAEPTPTPDVEPATPSPSPEASPTGASPSEVATAVESASPAAGSEDA